MLDVGVETYDDNPEQDELLINPNVILGDINERPKKRGGRHYFIVDYGDIPININ